VLGLFAQQSQAYIGLNRPPVDQASIVSLLANNPTVTTLDQFPALIPINMRLNFGLKHGVLRAGERGHLVETKVSQSSDPDAPRLMTWDERTGYTLSFNAGNNNQTANQRLDALSFDSVNKTWKLEALEFPIKAGHAEFTTTDCISCHGQDHRPIFSMYPDWPAFYGSDNDELNDPNDHIQEEELKDYLGFRRDVVPNHPRYKPFYNDNNVSEILGTTPYITWPYRQNIATNRQAISRAFTFRPLLRFGIVMNRLHAQSISKKITDHKNFDSMGVYFLHGLMQCRWPKTSDLVKTGLLTRTEELIGSTPRRVRGDTLHYRDLLKIFDLRVNDIDIRYSYNHKGYDNDDASKKIMEVGYIGNYWNSYFDGSATIDELVSMQLYNTLAARHPQFRGLINRPQGLSPKYVDAVERFKFDRNFFTEMDAKGMWLPIPYPRAEIHEQHHREGYPADFQNQHNALCRALERRMLQ
jgi:hypothetical protein